MKLVVDDRARDRAHDLLDAVARVPFEPRPDEPTPAAYYRDLIRPRGERDGSLERHLRYYLDLFEVAGFPPDGLRVLEAGFGFGLSLVLLRALGAAEAQGVELVEWQVEYARRVRDALPPEDAAAVDPVQGDVSAMPFPDDAVDLVLSLNAISHYLDYRPFVREAHRVLRPGGTLLVADGNNALNPLTRHTTRRIWASHEVDPWTDEVEDPDSPWLFVTKRERIVTEADPSLQPVAAHDLALRTAGMVREQIVAAVRAHAEDGTLPDSRYRPGTVSVHPEQAMVMERLFNPFGLAREIAEHGFSTRVVGHWAGASGSRPLRTANGLLRTLSRITMPTARAFRIVAVKRPSG